MLRALLLAPPGAGKGTQGELLAKERGVPHLATGDMLRRHVAEGTDIGKQAQAYMEKGELVPDEVVNQLVGQAVAGDTPLDGFVLDGFPRTLEQAQLAYDWGQANNRTFNAVVSLVVPEDELVRRMLARGEQHGRADDTEETVHRRQLVYEESTKPLLEFYRQRGILTEVDGVGTVDEVAARIRAAIDALSAD
ncbi:MAG: adenylate kinase [Actinobacteria bacterium]|nr:adenylate kinase [Actinomycetota bacterium]MBV8958945.1 adenylate kinase [Actinomycetota bacterium]MBV9662740.1 adenylate kinase [Actinomycetota bacterium]